MPKIKVNNLVKLYTLLLLNKERRHGYELIKEIEMHTQRKVSASQVYPFLKDLKVNGYLAVTQTGVRKKKVYTLTKSGNAFVKAMLNRFGGLIDVAIRPRLKVCAHCGCELYSGGYTENIKRKRLMFCCRHCARSYKSQQQ